nr:MAG TPA: hypothetical protein [Caudoviricetes sp.]
MPFCKGRKSRRSGMTETPTAASYPICAEKRRYAAWSTSA